MDVVVDSVRKIWADDGGREVVALETTTHRFRSGSFTCLLGPSGCGKSTLAQIVGGIESPSQGTVSIVDPLDAAGSKGRRSGGSESVMMWQSLNLFPWRNVIDNIAFGLEMAGMKRDERYAKAEAMLVLVGLKGFERHMPSQLSGGMRQRVALARALILDRPVLLMDEPFAALDAQTKIVMQEELMRIFEKTRKTVVFVTHSIEEAILLADDIVVMTARPGRIKDVIKVDLPRPRTLDIVNTPAFGALFDRVFHLIREEVTKSMLEQAVVSEA
jgi:NitT/TauT family transport system ATP-binding protein